MIVGGIDSGVSVSVGSTVGVLVAGSGSKVRGISWVGVLVNETVNVAVGVGVGCWVSELMISGNKNAAPNTTKTIPKPHVFEPGLTVIFSTRTMFKPAKTRKNPEINRNTPT